MKNKKLLLILASIACIVMAGTGFISCGVLENLSHTHNYTEQITSPTCTERGYTNYICKCGYNYKDNYINELGHQFTNYVPDNNATCEDDETETAKCDRTDCKETDIRTIGNTVLDYHTYTIGSTCYFCDISLSKVEKIIVADRVKNISDDAFYHYSNLTEIVIPDGVSSIGEDAFAGCSSLTKIVIPDSVTEIEADAFYGCDNLQYTERDGLKYLGNKNNPYVYLAEAQTDITEVEIPNGVKLIKDAVFSNCNSLKSIVALEDNTRYASQDGILYNKEKTKIIVVPRCITGEITIPGSMNVIENYAFADCADLTGVILSSGTTSIGNSAFQYCSSLTKIVISEGVTSIGYDAFAGCINLREITIPDSVICIGSYAFSGCNNLKYTLKDGLKYLGNVKCSWGICG